MSGQVSMFGVKLDSVRMDEAVSRLFDWVKNGNSHCRYVVTPNVDHTVMLQKNEGLRRAYDDADLILADGHPVVWASRLLGKPLPERVPGSELVPKLFSSAKGHRSLRVFLLGAAPGVALQAARKVEARWPAIRVVGTHSPPLGFENDSFENERILQRIEQTHPDVVVVGLGAPKQELWVHKHRGKIKASVALCVGATIDFLAGEKKRAPVWLQRIGMEWLHRMMSEPRRLVGRYARDAWIFPQLVLREMWTGSRT